MRRRSRISILRRSLSVLLIFMSLLCLFSFGANAETQIMEEEQVLTEEYIPGEYIIQYDNKAIGMSGFSLQRMQTFTEKNAQIERFHPSGLALVTTDEMTEEEESTFIEELENNPLVKHVEKNRIVTICSSGNVYNDPLAESQWGPEKIRAFDAWDLLPEDTAAVRVAVIDTGVDASHPDLAGRVIDGFNVIERNSSGELYDSFDASDDHGHGTHVAGIIAAVCDNALGIQGVVGKSNIEILPVKVLNDAGRGTTYDVIEGIRYAADNGASIINMSLGSSISSELERQAIQYAQNKGCLVIAAAGNDAMNVAYQYPASYPDVIAVGSVDINDNRSYFSNYGDRLDISAPGSSILSTIPKAIALKEIGYGSRVYGDDISGYYVEWSGTSMATAHVAGAAALYKAVNPSASNMDIAKHLKETARDVGPIGFDIYTGAGVVDAAAVLGEDIVKTALILMAPKSGELYETVNVRVQVNTSMNIEKVAFYLDDIDGTPIGEIECNPENMYYDFPWDTTKVEDGSYEFYAVAYDSEGKQVGETVSVNISILNKILDGFTLEVEDPAKMGADRAGLSIYGQKSDGSYEKIRNAYTTDLGFARIKNLPADYDEYLLLVNGSFARGEGEKNNYYIYRRTIKPEQLGTKIFISSDGAVKVDFSMKDENGNELINPQVIIAPSYKLNNEVKNLELLSPWKIGPDSEIYLDKGINDIYGYWSPDISEGSSNATYYLTNTAEITDDSKELYFDLDKSSLVTIDIDGDLSGKLRLAQIIGESFIPFVGGEIAGNRIYTMPGTYKVSAELESDYKGESWILNISKPDPVTIGEEDISVKFGANLKLTKFEPTIGIKEDQSGKFMYRGDILRTNNTIGDEYGNIINNMNFGSPLFNIHKIEGNEKKLIYQSDSISNRDSSYWNSGKDYKGSIPTAGDYVAELSFDAGPFGGESRLTIEFQLRNKSGVDEQDISIKMGDSIMPQAELSIFYWDNEANKWLLSHEGRANEDGRLTVPTALNLNSEGINLAVIKYSKKITDHITYDYEGFQVIAFKELDELENINLDENILVKASVLDEYGNKINAPIYLGVYSDGGGKLAKRHSVIDLKLDVGTNYAEDNLYIPSGDYPYIYSIFRVSNDYYYLMEEDIEIYGGVEIKLDGKATESIKVELPEAYKGDRFYPNPATIKENNFSGLTFDLGNTFRLTKGIYEPVVTVIKDNELKFSMTSPEAVNLSDKSYNWKIGKDIKGEVLLKQDKVPSNQPLIGSVDFRDSYNNKILMIEKRNGTSYKNYYPSLIIGTEEDNESEIAISSYGDFRISPEDFKGEGEHYLYLIYDIGDGLVKSEKISFIVGQGEQYLLTPEESEKYAAEYLGYNSLKLSINQGVKGYNLLKVNLAPSKAPVNITFRQMRNGNLIASAGMTKVFDSGENTVSAGFNLKGGDIVIVTVK